jgi:hypothetical protein
MKDQIEKAKSRISPDPHLAAQLHKQLLTAVSRGEREWRLPPGEHHIIGTYLPERFCHVTNNDHGLKRILFDVEGADDFTLDGQGAKLIFYGAVLPIRIGNSRRVTVRNLTIDWQRPFFTQAVVTGSGPGWLSFSVDADGYPLRVNAGRLIAFDGFGWQTDSLWNLLPFDPVRKEVSTRIENWHLHHRHKATDEGGGQFRLEAAFAEAYAPGTPIVLMHGNRVAPGVWIEDSQQVVVQDVTIHHAPAMGLVAQLSRDVTIERFHIRPSGDRLFSTWVDAVHLVDCDGLTQVLDCELSGQFDDSANIHASFSRVIRCSEPRAARLQHVHPQRYGPTPATPGTGLAFYRRSDMQRVLVTTVVSSCRINEEISDIVVADDLPTAAAELVCSRFNPDNTVVVRGCRLGANRGRGLLINLEHHILVEGNHFHVSGMAVESIPDANYWWEGSPVQDLTIRGNVFDDCGFGPCGDTLIHLGPELPDGSDPRNGAVRTFPASHKSNAGASVLRNVRILDNTIIRHRGRLLHAHGVDGLTFAGNRLVASTRYPVSPADALFDLGDAVNNAHLENPESNPSH